MINEYEKQAKDFADKTNTKMKVKYLKHDLYFDDDKQARDIYKITLKTNRGQYSFKFGQSIIRSEKPSLYDILACITKYPVEDFKNFCLEYGYNNDSIKALKIYKAVKKEYDNISRLYSNNELELLRDIN